MPPPVPRYLPEVESNPWFQAVSETRVPPRLDVVKVVPPTIVMFCNDSNMLHFSYQRYLENQLRLKYPLEGTPIRLDARKVENKEKEEK